MSTVNKKSLREEVERIKTDFNTLLKDKKISGEAHLLFTSMLTLINLLVAIFLEKNTKKNSNNSSIPPSQTEKDESSETKIGTHGKGKNNLRTNTKHSKTVETVTIVKVHQCDVCRQDLSKATCDHVERRTIIDIVFEKRIEHVDAEVKHCGVCDNMVKGKFPSNMPGPLQYGNGIKAYVINLLVCQMVALKRTQKLIHAMIGTIISEATFLKYIIQLYLALEAWEVKSTNTLLNSSYLHLDETSLRVDKKKQWVHVYAAGEITLKFLHPNRGLEAMNAINILPRYGGIAIHDCWASYLSYVDCGHALCGSHLTRELTAIIESNGYNWASNMKKLLLETCKKVSKRKRKKLTQKEYAALQKRYRNILTRGEKELPAIPKKPSGRRGKMAKSDAHNLWERLIEHESAVLLFSKRSDVPFTNNRSEQDLRMTKVKQKVSGCFRKEMLAKAYCRISSYLQTMANKGYNPLTAINMALDGEFI
jgi:hypothetical protein